MTTARFAPELQSATEARRFVEDELRPTGVGEDTLCHAQLLVAELVTNAARDAERGRPDNCRRTGPRPHRGTRRQQGDPGCTTIDTETRHRGLQLIEDLSEGWGVDVRGDDGKIVWCELASTGLAARKSAERRA